MNDLSDKVALVTGVGAKRGMGRAIAVQLAREEADMVIIDKYAVPKSIWPGDEDWGGLDTVAEEIKSQGRKVLAKVADVSNSKEVDEIVSATMKKFGKIDILVHCVGIRGPIPTPIVDLDEETWKTVLDINLTGAFLCTKAALPYIPDGGRIVNIASVLAHMGSSQGAHYAASKAGVISFSKSLARELAPRKITVNVVAPGATETDIIADDTPEKRKEREKITPLGRVAQPEEIADAVSYLLSEKANYITGETINVNGGMWMI